MGRPLLVLRLEGILQSYGEKAKWEYRDTSYIPTKSAIIGMIACAMGIQRGDKSIVELSRKLRMVVRVDRQGEKLTDFQIVKGYHTPYSSIITGGATKVKSNKITEKEYLQDAGFTVMLEGEEELLKDCLIALQAPKYQIFLGRKNCVPCRPVYECITYEYNILEEGITKYPMLKRHDTGFLLYEIETKDGRTYRYDETLGEVAMNYDLRSVSKGYVNSEMLEEAQY